MFDVRRGGGAAANGATSLSPPLIVHTMYNITLRDVLIHVLYDD